MAPFEAFFYALPVMLSATTYFPLGFREGTFVRLPVGDSFGIAEHAPLACLEEYQKYDVRAFLVSYAHFHAQIKSEPRDVFAESTVMLSALVTEKDVDLALGTAKTLVDQGYRCLKIKVFAGDIAREISKIVGISRLAGPRVSLRLDANGTLSLNDARIFLDAIKSANIEYFEEPVRDLESQACLSAEYPIALAADESFLSSMDVQQLPRHIKYLVLKPSCIKDIMTLISIVEQAKALGIVPILSPCFESEFSSCLFAMLAFRLKLLDQAHGLYEPHFFEQNVFDEPLQVKGGCLSLAHAFDQLSKFDFRDQSWLR